MDAVTARYYLEQIKKWLSEDNDGNPTDYYKKFLDALDVALDAVAPPLGAGRCAWVYLPDEDMTPYEHIALATKLIDALDPGPAPSETSFGPESGACLTMALMVYKSFLMHMHKARLREELQKAAANRDAAGSAPPDLTGT